MFTPSELERLPLELEALFSGLEERLMLDIVRRIAQFADISRTADYEIYRLLRLGYGTEQLKREIKRLLKLTDAQVDKIFDEAAKTAYTRDQSVYETAGVPFVPFAQNEELLTLSDAIKMQTKGALTNITNSMGFSVRENGVLTFKPIAKYYQDTLDRAALDIASGAFDYNRVLSRTVAELTNSGLRTVTYASGHADRIEVAARRAVMSGVTQLSAARTQQMMRELNTDLVEVSAHSTARPTHQVWQGRVFRWKEFEKELEKDKNDGIIQGANEFL